MARTLASEPPKKHILSQSWRLSSADSCSHGSGKFSLQIPDFELAVRSLEKTLMVGKTEGRRRRGDRG